MEDDEFIHCCICGKRLKELNSHLPKTHNLTREEYLLQFPNASMIAPKSAERKSKALIRSLNVNPREPVSVVTRRKLSAAGRERHRREREEDEELYLERQRRSAKSARDAKGPDFKHSEKTKQQMRDLSPHRGRTMTDESKRKLSRTMSGRKRGPHTPQTILAMKAAWARRKQDAEGYARYLQALAASWTPERAAAWQKQIAVNIKEGKHNGKSSNTKIERMMKEFLSQHQLDFEHQYILETRKGSWTFDFFVPSMNMFIETDSQYYHTKNLGVANRDELKERLATEMGFLVARISDKNWNPEIIFSSPDEIRFQSEAVRLNHLNLIHARLEKAVQSLESSAASSDPMSNPSAAKFLSS